MDEVRRVRQRNRRYDEPGSAPEVQQTPADKFRTGSFLVIDCLDAELRKRRTGSIHWNLPQSLVSCETLRVFQMKK